VCEKEKFGRRRVEMIRSPVVAGRFYSADPGQLRRDVERYLAEVEAEDVLGIVSPHAGYIYSGGVAGAVFSRVNIPKIVVILGPNHTGQGVQFGIITGGGWETPLGNVKVEDEVSLKLLNSSSILKEDQMCHRFEHSIEVQLPFLQCRAKNFSIIPICVGHARDEDYKILGREIGSIFKKLKEKPLIVASTDMTHYESQSSAERKDKKAIDAILSLDENLLMDCVKRESISMCGYAPTVAMLVATKALGAKQAELVKYATSGDVTGEYDQVVGYAGVIIK
jgi:hypothetical protein